MSQPLDIAALRLECANGDPADKVVVTRRWLQRALVEIEVNRKKSPVHIALDHGFTSRTDIERRFL